MGLGVAPQRPKVGQLNPPSGFSILTHETFFFTRFLALDVHALRTSLPLVHEECLKFAAAAGALTVRDRATINSGLPKDIVNWGIQFCGLVMMYVLKGFGLESMPHHAANQCVDP